MLESAKDDQSLYWLNQCANLDRLKLTAKDAALAAKNQEARADLEERRFRLGRSTTFNVIQAGDDATQANVYQKAVDVELRLVAWDVLRLRNQVFSQLKSYAKKFGYSQEIENLLGDIAR